jgi:hypothetical protein
MLNNNNKIYAAVDETLWPQIVYVAEHEAGIVVWWII